MRVSSTTQRQIMIESHTISTLLPGIICLWRGRIQVRCATGNTSGGATVPQKTLLETIRLAGKPMLILLVGGTAYGGMAVLLIPPDPCQRLSVGHYFHGSIRT